MHRPVPSPSGRQPQHYQRGDHGGHHQSPSSQGQQQPFKEEGGASSKYVPPAKRQNSKEGVPQNQRGDSRGENYKRARPPHSLL